MPTETRSTDYDQFFGTDGGTTRKLGLRSAASRAPSPLPETSSKGNCSQPQWTAGAFYGSSSFPSTSVRRDTKESVRLTTLPHLRWTTFWGRRTKLTGRGAENCSD